MAGCIDNRLLKNINKKGGESLICSYGWVNPCSHHLI